MFVHVFSVRPETRWPDKQPMLQKTGKMKANIAIGQIIKEELVRQGRSVAWLSRQLGTSRMTCYRIFDCYSIDTQMLFRISALLGHDFFKLYSDSLHEEELP